MKRQRLLCMFFAVAVLLFCYCELSYALTIHVGSTGTYSTIQSGYNAAWNGDTIQIQAGAYGENDNFNNNISVALIGGCDSSCSTNSLYSAITGTLIISNGTVSVENIIIQSVPSAPPEPWPLISPPISYISGTSCPVGSWLQCSQKIPNGPSCFYQSCTCYFSEYGVGDTDSGYWETYDASLNLTGIFDCEFDGGLTALQIREGACAYMYNPQVQAFIDSCATSGPPTPGDISGTWVGTYSESPVYAFDQCSNIQSFTDTGTVTFVISQSAGLTPYDYRLSGTVSMYGRHALSVPCGHTPCETCALVPYSTISASILDQMSVWSPLTGTLLIQTTNPPTVENAATGDSFNGTLSGNTITGTLNGNIGTFSVTKQ